MLILRLSWQGREETEVIMPHSRRKSRAQPRRRQRFQQRIQVSDHRFVLVVLTRSVLAKGGEVQDETASLVERMLPVIQNKILEVLNQD